MRELNNCLNLTRRIQEIHSDLYELRVAAQSPKSQVLTGMPHGGGGDNAIERYLIKCEKLEAKKRKLEQQRSEQWNIVLKKAKEANIPEQYLFLLELRFIEGSAWKRCAIVMNKKYGKWNINKVFRVYGKIKYNLQKV